jgi:glycosyltransferase involved in cell wall biosynthesis
MRYKLKRFLLESPASTVAGAIYNTAVNLELSFFRAMGSLQGLEKTEEDGSLNQLTAMIKSFERPQALKRLVVSIKKYYPDLHIIVVDDSRESSPLPGVEWVTLPFNSGLSAGRSAGLKRVITPYLLLLDDDIIFYKRTGLRAALAAMEEYPEVDIMGGAKLDLPHLKLQDLSSAKLFSDSAEPTYPPGSYIGPFPVRDKASNFYIARTERIRLVDWDPQIKLLEHADFFTRARGVLTTVYNDKLRCLHAKTPFDRHYMQYRGDYDADIKLILKRYGKDS